MRTVYSRTQFTPIVFITVQQVDSQ